MKKTNKKSKIKEIARFVKKYDLFNDERPVDEKYEMYLEMIEKENITAYEIIEELNKMR